MLILFQGVFVGAAGGLLYAPLFIYVTRTSLLSAVLALTLVARSSPNGSPTVEPWLAAASLLELEQAGTLDFDRF